MHHRPPHATNQHRAGAPCTHQAMPAIHGRGGSDPWGSSKIRVLAGLLRSAHRSASPPRPEIRFYSADTVDAGTCRQPCQRSFSTSRPSTNGPGRQPAAGCYAAQQDIVGGEG
nr:H179 [uncultured bacterium]